MAVIPSTLTEEHKKEALSRAFVQAVTAMAGIVWQLPDFDYGVDGTFRQIAIRGNRRVVSGIGLDFQLKATHRWSLSEGNVRYELEAKTFSDLVQRRSVPGSPLLLIVLCLPLEATDWMTLGEDQLILRHSAYWFIPNAAQPDTANSSTKTISIPASQRLTPDQLTQLLVQTQKGEWP